MASGHARLPCAVAFFAMIVSVGILSAEVGAFELRRVATSGGGVNSAGGSFALRATVGESGPVSGMVGAGSFRLGEGFWPGYEAAGSVDVDPIEPTVALANALEQNEPNPFYGPTSIAFTVAEPSIARLTVFDVAGRSVGTLSLGIRSHGRHVVAWSGRDDSGRPLTAGMYLYRLEVGAWSQTMKMLKLR